MSNYTLYIGTPNLSSWSLRAWLMLKLADINFNTVIIELDQPETRRKLLQISSSAKVPVLKHNHRIIWDSLAIGEYLAEQFPNKLWPSKSQPRVLARSIAYEMHSGFSALRKYLPMDIKARHNNVNIPTAVQKDIQRILQIWETCLITNTHSGTFLFGRFTIADAMYAPIATRFITYGITLPAIIQDYVNTLMQTPAMQEWCNI